MGFLWIECYCGIDFKVNGSVVVESTKVPPLVPLVEPGKVEMMMMMNESRRKLGSFQICALCTCCGGAKGLCLPSPCCYAINCNIPNRPFGFCSFTPKTCNCFGCHLWTLFYYLSIIYNLILFNLVLGECEWGRKEYLFLICLFIVFIIKNYNFIRWGVVCVLSPG